jgi:UDP-3-O-acyl-N-acetylglucosamine deacetylase
VTPETARYGALARTNCSFAQVLFSKTIGLFLADVRHLGYTQKNILIAGRHRYVNAPGLLHNGKSLEPAWHRAIMDLLAAISLIDAGRFVGEVVSYRAGHTLDVTLVRHLYERKLLVPVAPA